MIFTPTHLAGSYVISPKVLGDTRGWLMRTFCKKDFETIGHHQEWVQLNHSFTAKAGTIRGMHFQLAPHSEIKLVRCIAGRVWDVMVDLRKTQPTYLQWFATEISAENKKMMYIPEGFAHGFQALSNNAELVYCHSAFYNPTQESGLLYNDPKLNIEWPLPPIEISIRDQGHPSL